jgi:hypothetical protein
MDGIKGNSIKKSVSGTVYVILLLLFVCAPVTVFAVSYTPRLYHHEVRRDKFDRGDTLYMFHSGTDDVKKSTHVNDTVSVYRIMQSCEVVPIGLVKVISFVNETYIKGEVVSGEIKPDDIAKKGNVSCLIISAGVCDK